VHQPESQLFNKEKQKRIEILRADIDNVADHYVGNHSNCRDSFCKTVRATMPSSSTATTTRDPIPISEAGLKKVKLIFADISKRAHRLASNLNTNLAEQHFAIVRKLCNGRTNLTQRGAYQRRALISGLISLTGLDWHIRGLTKHKLPVCQPLLGYIEKRKKILNQPKSKAKKRKFDDSQDGSYGKNIFNLVDDVPAEDLVEMSKQRLTLLKVLFIYGRQNLFWSNFH
jgi:hypothetical protein